MLQTLQWDYCPQIDYTQAWELQKSLRQRRIEDQIPDTLLLLQHPPTITLGRHRGEESLLLSNEALAQRGVAVIRSDRGGDATLHAPGQLVGYLIVRLRERSLPQFVEAIADSFISTLNSFSIQAHYDTQFPGVWVGENKIVAFGFHLQKGVTMHGFAFNIETDLDLFGLIVPCGLSQKGVTSLKQLSPSHPSPQDIAPKVAKNIADALQLSLQHSPLF